MQPDISSNISTLRLDLRLLGVDHAPLSMELRAESFTQLKKWDIFTLEPSADVINLTDETKMCKGRIDRIEKRESLFYSIFRREDNRYLANVSLTKCDWNEKNARIGFWIQTSEIGKRYATEATKAQLNYGLNDLGLKIHSMHSQDNQNSQAVLLKLKFEPVPTDKARHQLPGGTLFDEMHYELKCHNDGSPYGFEPTTY